MAKRNQKHKKQSRKKGFPWLLAILGGGLLLLAVVLFARNGSGGGTPSIAVDQNQIDYGDVRFGVEKSFAIKVTAQLRSASQNE